MPRSPAIAGAIGLAFFALAIPASAPQAFAATACSKPVVENVPITTASKPYSPQGGTDAPAGAVREEFFVSCDVKAGHYKTLIQVSRPSDPSKESGIAIAEPWHPGDFWTIYDKAKHYITRANHVSVVIVGNPFVINTYMKKADAARYGSLTLPGQGARAIANTPAGETTEMEILQQMAGFIRDGAIPEVHARKVILGGMSQTGAVVRTYIAFEHKDAGVKSAYDGYFPAQAASLSGPLPDLDVPALELQGEREVVGELLRGDGPIRFRRDDGERYRLYEIAGAPHIATRDKIEPGVPDCVGHTWTNFPTDMVFGLALDHLVNWVDRGVAPPHMPRIEMVKNAREIKRDAYGNAVGGLRTSYLDVPVATYHASWGAYVTTPSGPSDPMAAKCQLIGWMEPLPKATLQKLYPTHAAYVAKVDKDIAALVRKKELLPDDAQALRSEAESASVP
jgi:hypothetical protein